MAKADEIRGWWKADFTQDRPKSNIRDSFFKSPRHNPGDTPEGQQYARCLPEQQLMVLCELTAQIAELNENLKNEGRPQLSCVECGRVGAHWTGCSKGPK